MNTVFKRILMILLVIFIYFIQLAVISNRTLFGIKPNLILITVIVISLHFEIVFCGTFGMISGIIMDIIYNVNYEKFGVYTMLYTIISIAIYFIRKNYLKNNSASMIYLVIIGTILFDILEDSYVILAYSASIKITRLIFGIILSIILNIVFALVIYNLVSKLEEKSKKSIYFK